MKKLLRILLATMIMVLFASSFSPGEASARFLLSPGEECLSTIAKIEANGNNQGSFYYSRQERCYLRYNHGFTLLSSRTALKNSCYPKFNVIEAVWWTPTKYADVKIGPLWYWKDLGCMESPNSGSVIKDPLKGNHQTGAGGSFGYEAQTCAGACRIDLHTLTGNAKNALGTLNGKVVGKTYVQIKDKNGDLDYGNFILCLQAMGAKNPAFFRFGGGNIWSYMGGYLKGSQVCVAGTMSGNYVLVDMGN